MTGCDIMGLTVEQFKAFSDAEQLQTIKELNDSGNVETIINILTDVGMENLSVPLLGELGRAYNNSSNEKEAIKVLESIDEEYRDAVWCGIIAVPMRMEPLSWIIVTGTHRILCNRC